MTIDLLIRFRIHFLVLAAFLSASMNFTTTRNAVAELFPAPASTAARSAAMPRDFLFDLQSSAIRDNKSPVAFWGLDAEDYTGWGSHSNRLIPVYTFGTKGAGPGIDLDSYTGVNSPYRKESQVRRLYGRVPTNTVNPAADYLDQTNLYDIQKAAAAAGKKHIFLVVFDGMDWHVTRAAAIYSRRKVEYDSGRGTGFHFQDYTAGGTSQFGFDCAAAHNEGTKEDVDAQTILNPGGKLPGGYNFMKAGPNPWTPGTDPAYLIGKQYSTVEDAAPKLIDGEHCYPDSSATATSMTAGIKTFNGAINVDAAGQPVQTIAHLLQEQGWSVGAVTSVPISHATPAAAYAHNVSRDDYQDLSRDLIGLKSIAHPETPLSGLDLIIGGGFGAPREKDAGQGKNFVPGWRYIAEEDIRAVDVRNGGKYTVAVRTAGVSGRKALRDAVQRASIRGTRLLGVFGVSAYEGHLPYRTADGDFRPTAGRRAVAKTTIGMSKVPDPTEKYTKADIDENPTLAEMTEAAIHHLSRNPKGFWLMVESGDVDWAMHDNNLDNAIGAIQSGDAAVKVITDWVEKHSNWRESLLIVTADHGHMLQLPRPELLIPGE